VVSSPNIGTGDNFLGGVVALSATDICAAGYACFTDCQPVADAQTLTMHWNGSAWAIVSSPNVAGQSNYILALGGSSSSNLWAVGQYSSCFGCVTQTLSLHWDGTQWTIAPSPNVGSSSNVQAGVTVLSNNDAWAVGYYYTPADSLWRTLTLHWNGTVWSVIPSPNEGQATSNYLYSISATASNDIWAVGRWDSSSGLTLHWDGVSWGVVPSPDSNSGLNFLYGVSAQASHYVWAV